MKAAEINEESQQLKLILTKQKDEALKGRFFFQKIKAIQILQSNKEL